MGIPVQRFILKCRPTDINRSYHAWQTAILVVFIAEADEATSLRRLSELLHQHRWMLIQTEQCATLIEDRVKQSDGAVWKAYQTAQQRGYWIEIFPDHFASGKDGIPPVQAPRLSEAFVDRLVTAAGGRRLTDQERNHDKTRNADYRLDDYIIELKDIQEEGMEKPERQAKLAALFRPYFPNETEILIDPSVLSSEDVQTFATVMGGPVKNAIKSAAEQIKATKAHLGLLNLRGGLIVLNSGYYSLPSEVFEQLVIHYARKETNQIEAVVCIMGSISTDGFNTWVNTSFYPPQGGLPVEERLGKCFSSTVDELMTDWSRNGFLPTDKSAPIPVPVAFEQDGVTYRYFPPGISPRWTPDSMKS